MRRHILYSCVAISMAMLMAPSSSFAKSAEDTIRDDVLIYMKSINAADTTLGATVWATTPQSTFIHPFGHERGWDQIKGNFYEKIMGGALKDRTLKPASDISVTVYGDSAVVEFDWDFNATFVANGQPLHTTGRESQVYEKLPGLGWRIVQIHYSPPPAKELAKGL